MVVLDALLQQQLVGLRPELPPRRDVAAGSLAAELLDDLDAPVEDLLLLLGCQRHRVLVAVAVHPDLVAGVRHRPHLLGEGLGRVAGDEPGGLDPEALEQPEQARAPDLAGEQAACDVAGAVLAAVGAEPARDRVDVDPERAEDLFRHSLPLLSASPVLHLSPRRRPPPPRDRAPRDGRAGRPAGPAPSVLTGSIGRNGRSSPFS